MHYHISSINLLFFSESCKPKDNSAHSLKSKVDIEILGLKMLPGGKKSPSVQRQQIWLMCQLSLSRHTTGSLLGEGMVQKRSVKGKQSFDSGDPSVVYEPWGDHMMEIEQNNHLAPLNHITLWNQWTQSLPSHISSSHQTDLECRGELSTSAPKHASVVNNRWS